MSFVSFLNDLLVEWTAFPPVLNTYFSSGLSVAFAFAVLTIYFWYRELSS